MGLEGDYYDLKDDVGFSSSLEYFAEGILDALRHVIKTSPEQSTPQPRMEPHHQQILDYIHERGSITQREYGAIFKRSLASRKLDFEKLLQLNLIEVKGIGRRTYYVLAKGR